MIGPIAAIVMERHRPDWHVSPLTTGDVLHMPEIEVELLLSEIYVVLEGPSEGDAPAA